MGYHAPTSTPEKTPDPLINLSETSADVKNQRNKQGYLSSFLQGTRNRSSGFLANLASQPKQASLGSNAI